MVEKEKFSPRIRNETRLVLHWMFLIDQLDKKRNSSFQLGNRKLLFARKNKKTKLKSWAQRFTSVTPILRRLKQKNPRIEGQFGLYWETLSEEKRRTRRRRRRKKEKMGEERRWGRRRRGERKGVGGVNNCMKMETETRLLRYKPGHNNNFSQC